MLRLLRGGVLSLLVLLALAGASPAFAASADLSVSKVDTPDPVAAGGLLTYTITVTNAGPDAAALVKLQDQQPTGTAFNSVSGPDDWSCSGPEPFGEGTINCSPVSTSMDVGSAVFTVTLLISPSTAPGTVYTNTATVSSATDDPNPGGESSTARTTVAAAPIVQIPALDATGLALLTLLLALGGSALLWWRSGLG